MPVIQVTMLKGRTVEQKRKLAERLTQAMVEEANATKEAVTITFVEVSREDYASGGILLADRLSPAS
jgi:4-oxalocrotonate tautomerase